jgi:ABC-type nitrate/sulfonate/bicarbonate transport system substrate-binding protein
MRQISSMKAKFFALVCLIILLMVAIGRSLYAASPSPTIVRVGYPQLNGAVIPLWTIQEGKLDRPYGVDFKPIYIPGGSRLTQTAVSGDVDIALTGGAVINAILSGAELMYIALQVPTYAFSLYGRPEVKEVSDLRGKILGVITKGAASDHASIALLRLHKMTQKDMKVLYFSRQQDALAALDKGIVNAAVLSAPTTLMARRLGYKQVVNIGSLKLPYTFIGAAVNRSLARQNPEVIKSFLKAFMAGLKASKDQPALAKQSSARHFGSQDPEIADEAYNSFVPLFPRVPYVLEEAVRGTLAATDHPKAATADPKMFFDNRFLQELESSGFVKELYGNK